MRGNADSKLGADIRAPRLGEEAEPLNLARENQGFSRCIPFPSPLLQAVRFNDQGASRIRTGIRRLCPMHGTRLRSP